MMSDVIVALIPALLWAVYVFGTRALAVTAISVVCCVGFDALGCKLMKRSSSAGDLSAVVTGLILAYLLPVTVPLWMPIIGAFFAILIVKQLFGGIGKNIVNPALAAYAFLRVSFADSFVCVKAFSRIGFFAKPDVKAATASDPIAVLMSGVFPETPLADMFFGFCPGSIGEVSSLLLICGGVYLIIRKIIDWRVTVSFLAASAIFAFAFPRTAVISDTITLKYTAYQLFSGSLMLNAVFTANDPVTSPSNDTGRLIYGACCGLGTMLLRYFGAAPACEACAILTMNLMSGFINRLMSPKRR